ncbi:MAG: carbonic anhydrase family protein [Zoogloeaceae bacterium]|jgi:carbonic anhydrase|nr:carbonic anhydrase family protein [Zoogloeaceae bacterium]
MKKTGALLLLCTLLAASPAGAQAWRTVIDDGGRRVALDDSLIEHGGDGQITVTSRLSFPKPLPDVWTNGQSYQHIQTRTRFDCEARTAATLSRSYLKPDLSVLREEKMAEPIVAPVKSGTFDDKLMREVCRPIPTLSASANTNTSATSAAAAAGQKLHAANEAMWQKQLDAIRAAVGKPELGRHPARTAPASSARSSSGKKKAAKTPKPTTWSYDLEAPGGPAQWSAVDAAYAACNRGQRQSPINLDPVSAITAPLPPIDFDYRPAFFEVQDTSEALTARFWDNRLMLMGKRYELTGIHFHRPAEETIGGHGFDAGIHFVHRADDGQLLILAVLLEKGDKPLAALDTLFAYLPLERGQKVAPFDARLDPAQFLPTDTHYFTYSGSLTTPPCTEGVVWVVLPTPVEISAEQEAVLARLHPMNARPIQPTNGRIVKTNASAESLP